MLHAIRLIFYKNYIVNCNHDLKSIYSQHMFGLYNKFLGCNIIRILPDCPSVEYFSIFFNTKIKNIISYLPYHSTSNSQILLITLNYLTHYYFTHLIFLISITLFPSFILLSLFQFTIYYH